MWGNKVGGEEEDRLNERVDKGLEGITGSGEGLRIW